MHFEPIIMLWQWAAVNRVSSLAPEQRARVLGYVDHVHREDDRRFHRVPLAHDELQPSSVLPPARMALMLLASVPPYRLMSSRRRAISSRVSPAHMSRAPMR